jgi:hypothetical protein
MIFSVIAGMPPKPYASTHLLLKKHSWHLQQKKFTWEPLENPTDWVDWKQTAKADIAGGIGGATGGSMVGGVGTGPGFAGGAIAASIGDIAYQAMDAWF